MMQGMRGMGMLQLLAIVMLIVNSDVGFSQDSTKDGGTAPTQAGQAGSTEIDLGDPEDFAHDPPIRPNWDIASRNDVPWLGVIYQEPLPANPTLKTKQVRTDSSGLACGGALLSPNKVLTLCACVRSFLLISSGRKFADDPDDIDIIAAELYVTFCFQPPLPHFIADQKYVLSHQPHHFMPACFNLVDQVERSKKKDLLRTKPTVMLFAPEVGHLPVLPVKPIVLKAIKYKFYAAVFGLPQKNQSLVLFDDSFQVFHSEKEGELNYFRPEEPFSGWENVKCTDSEYCQTQTWKGVISESAEMKSMMRCVCNKSAGFQLCGGLPGFPFMAEEDLIGLMATPMECTSGNQIALLFDNETVDEISAFVRMEHGDMKTSVSPMEWTKTPTPRPASPTSTRALPSEPHRGVSHSHTFLPAKSSGLLLILHSIFSINPV